jgi:hypothetical protein
LRNKNFVSNRQRLTSSHKVGKYDLVSDYSLVECLMFMNFSFYFPRLLPFCVLTNLEDDQNDDKARARRRRNFSDA